MPHLTRLRQVRDAKALSQAELAEKANVSRNTIARIEAHGAGATYATLRKLAEALGVSPQELVGDA